MRAIGQFFEVLFDIVGLLIYLAIVGGAVALVVVLWVTGFWWLALAFVWLPVVLAGALANAWGEGDRFVSRL